MKKLSIIFVALAASFALSCNKEMTETETTDPSAPAGMKKVTITATAEGATKTSYTDDGQGKGIFSWTKGDQISVMGTDYNFYTLTAEQTGASVSFSGYISEEVTLRQEAFFPAAEHYCDGSNYYFHIPEYKDMSKHFSADLPMGAYSGTETYQFKHITGAALLTFTNFPADVETAEIAVVNESLKLSGKFGTWTDSGLWVYGVAGANSESEGKFVRKVPVTDGQAQVYLPYACDSNLWAKCDVSITGYDSKGTAKVLLAGKTMNAFSQFERAQVVPCSPLELPDYIDFDNIDWTADNVAVATNDDNDTDGTMMKELRAVADSKYLYLKATTSTTTLNGANHFDVSFCDGEGDNEVWWGWTTKGKTPYWNEHKGSVDAEGNLVSMQYSHNDTDQSITCHTVIEAEKINWYLAYPIEYVNVYKNSVGKAYVSCLLWQDFKYYWACPARGNAMLEVTLP